MKSEFKVGQKVEIVSVPQTNSNIANYDYQLALEARIGTIRNIFLNGDRNIVVSFGKWNNYVYLSASNINPISLNN